ncbi:transposase [Candidatus Erwinia dacicola]|uniref:Transposase n=1 Tax=Candidatus Erwinia dacicola TaxID=252393 RepID=A0A328TT53_9GAMM|nr:hypothetical protein ACZ87_00938 [Candidatus Erwinia dacicola]
MENSISNFLTGKSATATVPRSSNAVLFPTVLALNISPAEAELKQKPSHFEIDTIFGKDQKSLLLTLVDKALKIVTIRKLPNKRAETVVVAFRDIEANTFCEFIVRPYHSWERRLNEHTNGLIRHFHPKATDFSQVSHRKIAELKHTLNTRGQKSLGYRSPNEVFLTHLLAA